MESVTPTHSNLVDSPSSSWWWAPAALCWFSSTTFQKDKKIDNTVVAQQQLTSSTKHLKNKKTTTSKISRESSASLMNGCLVESLDVRLAAATYSILIVTRCSNNNIVLNRSFSNKSNKHEIVYFKKLYLQWRNPMEKMRFLHEKRFFKRFCEISGRIVYTLHLY